MAPSTADGRTNTTTTTAANPNAAVPSNIVVPTVAVASVLCLIAFVGAVVLFVRAYRARKRRKEHEGRVAERRRRRRGERRGGDKPPVTTASAAPALRRGGEGKFPGGPLSRRDMFADLPLSPPPPQPPPPPKQQAAKPASHGRRALEDRYQRGRIVDSIAEGMALCGPAYSATHYHHHAPGIETSEGVFPAVPVVGKAERILGTPVSSDLYADRATWGPWQAAAHIRRQHNDAAHIRGAPSPPPSCPLPRTPCTDRAEASCETPPPAQPRAQSLPPSPPPPPTPPPVTIEEKYPSVGKLARANSPVGKPPGRLSYTLSVSNNPTEHIYTQHSHPSPPHRHRQHQQHRSRRSIASSHSSMQVLLDPPSPAPLSPAPLGSPFLNPRRATADSGVRTCSWSGRSVLDLDPPLPPTTGTDLDYAGSSEPQLYRCYSAKSYSSASSFNTLTHTVVPLHGLSPTPPRNEERSVGTIITDKAEKEESGVECEARVECEAGVGSETGGGSETTEGVEGELKDVSERARKIQEEKRVSWEMCKAWVGENG